MTMNILNLIILIAVFDGASIGLSKIVIDINNGKIDKSNKWILILVMSLNVIWISALISMFLN